MSEVYKNLSRSARNVRMLRERQGYSMRDMAAIIGIPHTTLQRYENGTAAVPKSVVEAMRQVEKRDKEFFKRYRPGGEFDKSLTEEHPHGIMSEAEGWY